ncbi:MAG: HPP family protein [Candidatus Eisenbacteria bacterium]|nr:HPP family protein [Candidatus Eisenbacteria bacterium]
MAPLGPPFDDRFGPHWVNYVLQSAFAAASIFVVLAALRQQNLVVAASLAATAFTVFAVPSSVTASMRNVVGGHVIGLLFGSVFALIQVDAVIAQDAMYALAVGGAMFTMAVTNTEHPPAAGTALGVLMTGFSWRIVLGVVVGVLVLALLHRLLRPFLRDLVAAPETAALHRADG